jgi:hypothetical protein
MNDDDRRLAERSSVRITADLRRPGRTPFHVVVLDLSQTGCRCETTGKVHVGDTVWLTLPKLAAIESEVRWITPMGFGCAWTAPMHISVFDHIRRRFPSLIA